MAGAIIIHGTTMNKRNRRLNPKVVAASRRLVTQPQQSETSTQHQTAPAEDQSARDASLSRSDLLSLRGSGKGLWIGSAIADLGKMRDEWSSAPAE